MTDVYSGDPDAPRGEPADAELIADVRSGDALAFDVLYRRHVEAAQRMARALARNRADADDLVAESFARMLSVLRAGGGPDIAFRPYLLTTMRNLFYEGTKHERRLQVTDDISAHEPGVPFVDTAVQQLELSLVSRAFAQLPERWQVVLWHTEVERERPATVAPLLGLSPNGVAALAYRAREGLRQNYLQEHIAAEPDDECRWAIERLGAYVRDGLALRDRSKVDGHLSECRRCHLLFVELGEVNAGMREVLAPALLAGSAAGYLVGGKVTAIPAITFWGPFRRIARRRSTQVAAGATVLAALIALALTLASQPTPISPPDVAAPPVRPPAPTAGPVAPPSASPEPTPSIPSSSPEPQPAPPAAALEAKLEPVGSLVRGRDGVLAMTVANRGETVAFGPRALAWQPTDTGPLTAMITVPAGVKLRANAPGDGWQCTAVAEAFSCKRSTLSPGQTTRAFIPVEITNSAVNGTLRLQLTAPRASATSATGFGDIQTGGHAATFAGTLPATVVTGGNSLMSCFALSLGCVTARNGGALLGRVDNGDHYMTGFSELGAPHGVPSGAMVSGANIPVRGKVVWAGLYWSGTGIPPANPKAFMRVPGTSRYVTVKPNRVDRVGSNDFTQSAYQASADVTAAVKGTSGGMWWVAVDHGAFGSGIGAFGGWALVVVVEDGGPLRTVAVLDGYLPLRPSQSVSANVYGASGAAAKVALIGWEGDRGLAGDQLKLGGQPLGGSTSGNVAASLTDGTPAGWNTFGVDARVFNGKLATGLGQPTITAITTEDAWILGTIAISALTEP
ncbi:MAG TPA: hypothetical protein DGT23_26320 [Micromonosporaceae bacterium]|nr:hypothetical protein [Micromonosporaceae bacterium]